MSKISKIFEFMQQCPQLKNLFSIAGTTDAGVRVILPQGTSPKVAYDEGFDALGNYTCNINPYPSVYEDYQINCYELYDPKDQSAPGSNANILTFDEVQAICDWVELQNTNANFPEITGKNIIAIECNPFMPQIRGIDQESGTIAYFITLRIRYVNTVAPREVYFDNND